MSEAPTLIPAGRREAAGTAVAEMYERHARSLYGLCRMLLRDPHEAEDALQATFLAAHGALVRGGGPRDEGAWLASIARNECRGRVRERMQRPLEAPAEALASVPDPALRPDERLGDPGVGRALAQLPESQRDAVVLHDVFGLRAREVGRVLGMSVPAVEALLFRGRRQLRGRLRPLRGGALAVPAGVRDGLGQLIPGFASGDTGPVVVGGAGAAGVGLLAKLAGAPVAAKVAAGVATLAAAGSVAVVGGERARDGATAPRTLDSSVRPGPAATGSGAPGVSGVTTAGSGRGDAARGSDATTRGHGSAGQSADRSGQGGDADDEAPAGRTAGQGPADGDEQSERASPSSGPGSGTASEAEDDAERTVADESSGSSSGPGSSDDAAERSESSGESSSGSSSTETTETSSGSDSSSGSSGSGSSGSGSGEPDDDDPPAPLEP